MGELIETELSRHGVCVWSRSSPYIPRYGIIRKQALWPSLRETKRLELHENHVRSVFVFFFSYVWFCGLAQREELAPPPHIFSWYRNVLCGRLNSLFFPLSFCWCVLLSIFSPFSRFFFRLCFVRFVFLGGGLAKSRYT